MGQGTATMGAIRNHRAELTQRALGYLRDQNMPSSVRSAFFVAASGTPFITSRTERERVRIAHYNVLYRLVREEMPDKGEDFARDLSSLALHQINSHRLRSEVIEATRPGTFDRYIPAQYALEYSRIGMDLLRKER